MKNDKLQKFVPPTAELLSEIESIMILGGTSSDTVNIAYKCTNIYCSGGNCIQNCSCSPNSGAAGCSLKTSQCVADPKL